MNLPDIVMDASVMTSVKLQQGFVLGGEREEAGEGEQAMEVVCGVATRGDGLSSDSGLTLSQGYERITAGACTPSPVSGVHCGGTGIPGAACLYSIGHGWRVSADCVPVRVHSLTRPGLWFTARGVGWG